MKHKNLGKYRKGEKVEVQMRDAKTGNNPVWRAGVVDHIDTVYPNTGERHKPYPMLFVKVMRTYCKATPVYIPDVNVKIWMRDDLEFYEKENVEGFVYAEEVRPLDPTGADEYQLILQSWTPYLVKSTDLLNRPDHINFAAKNMDIEATTWGKADDAWFSRIKSFSVSKELLLHWGWEHGKGSLTKDVKSLYIGKDFDVSDNIAVIATKK